jgi:flavin reductase (DIM6/NTAB) family NADH-FMN oxidoreductase RutF
LEHLHSDEYRKIMGHLASGVTVVTAVGSDGQVAGMTATAVTSVSLDPPLILVCVNTKDPLHSVLSNAAAFAVNVLARDQETISSRFAGRAEERFEGVDSTSGPHGLPLLKGTVSCLVCEPWGSWSAGDHTVFVGLVTVGSAAGGNPLLHFRGEYTTTADAD